MRLDLLRTRRPDVDLDLLADYGAAFKGGKAFRARIEHFLPPRPSESPALYAYRKSTAHYLNYAGPIVSYLSALVFTEKAEIVGTPAKVDDFYTAFQKDCDRRNGGMPLLSALRERLTRALVEQRSWILVDFPKAPTKDDGSPIEPDSMKQWEEMHLGRAYLCPLDECDVIDWEVDDAGELEWALVHQVDMRRRSIDSARGGTITERWTHWGRDEWVRYEVTYEKDKPPAEDAEIEAIARGHVATQGQVPLVRVELPEELWAMNILFDAQIEQTRKRNNLSWGMDRTCFAREVHKVSGDAPAPGGEDSGGGKGPVVGPGYREIIGEKEELYFHAPGGETFGVIADYVSNLKDEIYRVVHQMALGVDNNAAAVGRSGESKQADADATIVVVRALAEIVRLTLQRVLDLVALGRKERIDWSIGGMNGYAAIDVGALTESIATMDSLAIPSATAKRELWKDVLNKLLRGAPPEVRAKIAVEVDAAITVEDVHAAIEQKNAPPPPMVPPPSNDTDDEDEEAAAED